MPDMTFQILGPTIPKLVAREKIMARIWADLTKKTPSHLSIVGPRFSGKSVILKELKKRFTENDSPYQVVIEIDLGHQTPEDNMSFLKILCKSIGESLSADYQDYSDHLLSVEESEYDEIREVLSALDEENVRILILFDGFDKVLAKGRITRNLWDQMRELASGKVLRLVTVSRKPLYELIRSDESATSDFWGIFDTNPVKVGVFDETDVNQILKTFHSIQLDNGAKTEIENWTGYYPPLYLSMLNAVQQLSKDGVFDNSDINLISDEVSNSATPLLATLWQELPETAKDTYRYLVEKGKTESSKFNISDKTALIEKGFIKVYGNKIIATCRLLEKYIASLGDDVGSITRLFGDERVYEKNIRSVLEHRLNHIQNIDDRLKRKIQRAIEDIPEHTEDCIENIRSIIDRALDLIWQKELNGDKEIPNEYFRYWQSRQEQNLDRWGNQFPVGRAQELRLLNLLTGTMNSVAKADYVTKNTYVLANALKSFGDFGQHLEGAKVPLGVAINSIMLCIELSEQLSTELANKLKIS